MLIQLNMNKLANLKQIAFTFIFALVGVISLGQSLHGSGTEDDPFVIESEDDWGYFAKDVNGGYDYHGQIVVLTKDIKVSEMVGRYKNTTNNAPFRGIFDGRWHTLSFNKGSDEEPFKEENCAPFRFITDATIKNLAVEGTIKSSKRYSAGFVGWSRGNEGSHITNCISSIFIDCQYYYIVHKQNS